LSLPVDLKVAADGSLYYLSHGSDSVNQIIFTGTILPFITSQPNSLTVSVGETATFSVGVSGDEPISYQWQRGGVDIEGPTSSSLVLTTVTLADNGAQFRVRISNP